VFAENRGFDSSSFNKAKPSRDFRVALKARQAPQSLEEDLLHEIANSAGMTGISPEHVTDVVAVTVNPTAHGLWIAISEGLKILTSWGRCRARCRIGHRHAQVGMEGAKD